MPKRIIDPTTAVGEILGEPSTLMRNPVNAGYQCPFINSTCIKRSQRFAGPYPVCSIHRSSNDQRLMCVCPKRMYEANLLRDVIDNCWVGSPPANPRIAYEVQMAKFGNVDFVIADVTEDGSAVRNFVSVEVQAVDISGSVEPAYSAIISNVASIEAPTYGANWANVRKRYITQLINKGFYHHHWGTRMVSVIQTRLYEYFKRAIDFDELDPKGSANIVFLVYDYVPAPEKGVPGAQKLVLDKVIGTSHNSLMLAAMYRTPPSKEVFCRKILEQL